MHQGKMGRKTNYQFSASNGICLKHKCWMLLINFQQIFLYPNQQKIYLERKDQLRKQNQTIGFPLNSTRYDERNKTKIQHLGLKNLQIQKGIIQDILNKLDFKLLGGGVRGTDKELHLSASSNRRSTRAWCLTRLRCIILIPTKTTAKTLTLSHKR